MRFIPDEIDRAKLRTTLLYLFSDRIRAGIEWNPLAEDASVLVNVHVVREARNRPAVIFGLSSDRIGTPSGTSLYLTASKDLQHWTGLPIAPYAGVVWGSYEHRFRPIGGLNIRFHNRLTSLIQFDGVKVHPGMTYTFSDTHALTFLMIRGKSPGMTYTFSF